MQRWTMRTTGSPPGRGLIQLQTIHLENFKSIRSLRLELRGLNVLSGPNNGGKSTLLSAIRLLEGIGWLA